MLLTTRQKFSLVFCIYVSALLALVGIIFLVVLHTLLTYQIQKDAAKEATNALKNHIRIKEDNINVIKDQTGGSLADQVIESNVSILLLDKNLNVYEGFGILNLYQEADRDSVNVLASLASEASTSLKSKTRTVSWRGQNLSVYVAPVKNGGQSYGTIISAKSLTQVESLEKIIQFSLLGLILLSTLLSLALSRKVAHRIFKPIRDLTGVISTINLDQLDKTLDTTGHRSDELVVLGEKFNAMLIRLKSMSEQQKEFIANASHELKTPLTRAITTLDMAKAPTPVQKELRSDLFEINKILDKLMFLSKLKPGIILPSDKLSITKLIKNTTRQYLKEAQKKNITIKILALNDAIIILPKEYAKILLGNLISNAIKYSLKNSTIKIFTEIFPQKLYLHIADHGIGIKKADLTKIGERFYRGTTATSAFGHGIGFSIVRKITEIYKIGLEVKSEAGKGTEVILEFPQYNLS